MDSKNQVTAQPEPGLCCIYMDEGMTNFRWKSRDVKGGKDDDPMFLFEGDATFQKCKSAGDARVYFLHVKATNMRKFFWMQDKNDAKDVENSTKMDDIINGKKVSTPSSSMAMDTSSDVVDAVANIAPNEIQALQELEPAQRAQVMAMLGITEEQLMGTPAQAPNPSSNTTTPNDTTTTETPAPQPDLTAPPPINRPPTTTTAETPVEEPATSSTQPMTFSADTLRNVMAGVGAVLQAKKQENTVALSDVLSSEQLSPLLGEEAFVSALVPLLPEGQQTIDALKDNVASPQYAQALASFSHALSSEDAIAMMSQFGVDPKDVAEGGGGVAGLLSAIQKQVDGEDKKESSA